MVDATDRFAASAPGCSLAIVDRRRSDRRDSAADRRRDRDARAAAFSDTPPRPDAGFVAHLIATSLHAPQTRLLRRAEANAGTAAYRSVTISLDMQPGGARAARLI